MKLDPTKTTVVRYGKLLDNDKNYVAKYQESSVVSLLTKGNAKLRYTMFFLFFFNLSTYWFRDTPTAKD